MTHQIFVIHSRGFTLMESVLYIGLLGILFAGIFGSIYPLLSNAERLTKNILTEGESAFVLAKINYALSSGTTDPESGVSVPEEGETANTLVLSRNGEELFRFEEDVTHALCTPPRLCGFVLYGEGTAELQPLNSDRVRITDFAVTHTAPYEGVPRSLEVTFTANGVPVGPALYHLPF